MQPQGLDKLVIEEATNVATGHIDHDATLDQCVMSVWTTIACRSGPGWDVGTDCGSPSRRTSVSRSFGLSEIARPRS
jgi:hypothetical protein